MGVKVLEHFSNSAPQLIEWIQKAPALHIQFPDLTREILQDILMQHSQTAGLDHLPEFSLGLQQG
jgi:hypothetical protein